MTTTTIHFIRHGQVYNPEHVLYERLPGFHLSERGRLMAQTTARYLANNPSTSGIAAVYASPLDRTVETAQEVLAALNQVRAVRGEPALKLITDQRIIEAGNEFRGKRIGHGQGSLWRNDNFKLMTNLWKPSWGESYEHIGARMRAFTQEKIDQYHGEQIAVVSHESPIWSFRHLLETGHAEHNMLLRHTALASVTSISFDDDTHAVVAISYADPAAGIE